MASSPSLKLLEEVRDFPRKRCKWTGLFKHKGTQRPCIVEDISAGGCRVAVKSKGLEKKDRVIIEVESRKLRFHGEIRWVRTDEAGVEFLFMD